jgi:hypothetical protein
MSVLLLADTHFTDKKRDAYRMASLPLALSSALDKFPVSDVVIAGDLCEEKDRHPAGLVDFVVGFVEALAKRARLWVVMGNHDYIDPAVPFWKFLGKIKNVEYVSDPRVVRLAGGIPAVLMPHSTEFVGDWKYIQEWLGEGKASRPAYFIHQTVEGAASYGHTLSGLSPSMFAKAPSVFSGDVHKPQKIGNVQYVGSPYPICFGDDYVGRLLVLNDVDETVVITDEVTVDSPRKIKVEVGSLEDLPGDVAAGDMVKVVVSVARSQIVNWAELREGVLAWAEKKGVDLFGVELREKSRIRLTEAASVNVAEATSSSVFSGYCEAHSVSDDKRLVGEEILKEVK